MILWQRDHCNDLGPGISFGAGYSFILSLVGWLGQDEFFPFSPVSFKQRSGTITGCMKL